MRILILISYWRAFIVLNYMSIFSVRLWERALNISADRKHYRNELESSVCHGAPPLLLRGAVAAASRWWIGQRWLILAIIAGGQVFSFFLCSFVKRCNLEEKLQTNLIWTNGVCRIWHRGLQRRRPVSGARTDTIPQRDFKLSLPTFLM